MTHHKAGHKELPMQKHQAGQPPAHDVKQVNDFMLPHDGTLDFRFLIENSLTGIYIIQDGVISYINQAGAAMFAYAAKELIGTDPLRLVHPDDCTRMKESMRCRLTGEIDHLTYTFHGLRKDKRSVCIEVFGRRIDLNGRPAILDNILNVTERKLSEEARLLAETSLAASEKRMRFAAEAAGFGFYTWDFTTGQLQFSPELLSLYGLAPDGAHPMGYNSFLIAIHPDDRPAFQNAFETSMDPMTTGRLDLDYRIKRADGLLRWLRIRGGTTFAGSGKTDKPLSAEGIIYDITERKLAEVALRESEERFRTLVEYAGDGFELIDKTGRYINVNAATLCQLGYTRDEILGLSIYDVDPNATPEQFATEYNELLKPTRRETIHRRKDGTIFPVEFTNAPLWLGGVKHTLTLVRDITERKHLEEQFRQAQKMEAVGLLAGGVAHDFNNILSAIMMNIGLMQNHPGLGPEMNQMLNELKTETRRAADLTRQLLLFSRRSTMEKKLLDMNDVVAGTLKMLRRLIGEHIDLRFNRDSGESILSADAGMLEQIIMNLAVNARDAMPKGGILTIGINRIHVHEERAEARPKSQQGEFVCLSVSDSGCGMDEEIRKHIFEPFFTTKESGKGTGLGLATVYGIVIQHNGWIETECEAGMGTTIRVFLPASPQSAIDKSPSDISPVFHGHETILLVEDDPFLRHKIGQGLRSLEYHVIEASDGHQALQKWQEYREQIDMLFSDMVMPGGMTGIELAQHLINFKSNLKVIITSGYSEGTTDGSEKPMEGLAYLQKPYTIRTISKAIRDCFDGRHSRKSVQVTSIPS
jgi:two-component system, cell cycle sensor histidine kinase and response regulator CckA